MDKFIVESNNPPEKNYRIVFFNHIRFQNGHF